MECKKIKGKHVYLVDAKWVTVPATNDPTKSTVVDAKFGLLASDLKKVADRGLSTPIAQFYELVGSGLILTRHIFKGLDRRLFCDGNANADKDKLIYTRRPSTDYEWERAGTLRRLGCPPGKVFAVIVSPNEKHLADYPIIQGWIEHWNWVHEDRGLLEAPEGWLDRYDTRLWTRV